MSDWNDDANDPLALDFDPAAVERRPNAFDPLPPGDYPVTIAKIEAKKTKDEQSVQAVIEIVVDDGDYKGRRIWSRQTMKTIRTDEKGLQSLSIGSRMIAEMMDACGVGGKSMSPCIGLQCVAKLKVRPAANGYDASNDVVAYKPRAGASVITPRVPVEKPAAAPPSAKPGFMSRKS